MGSVSWPLVALVGAVLMLAGILIGLQAQTRRVVNRGDHWKVLQTAGVLFVIGVVLVVLVSLRSR